MKILQRLGQAPTSMLVALLLAAGIAERALWNWMRTASVPHAEAFNVAVAVAQGRGLADAFQVGQGPTAHLLPLSPLVAGAVYALFGVTTLASEFLLACWSIGLAIGTYFLLFRAFGHLGSSRASRLIALAFGCLAPTYIAQEAVDFRYWEGGLAVFLGALFLERLLAASSAARLGVRVIVGMSFLAALLFFVNPVVGIGAYLCAALTCIRRLKGARMLLPVGIAACMLALFVAPWTIRNELELGSPVALRSNAGLELALANYAGALDPIDPEQRFKRRLLAIHPYSSASNYQAMQRAGGEVGYSKLLGSTTWAWIDAHRGLTAEIALLHLRELVAPEPWLFRLAGTGLFAGLRAGLASLIGVLGLLGIGRALIIRRPLWEYPALLVIPSALCFSLFQPIPRYTYLFYPLLIFCAADLFTRPTREQAGPIHA
jgi:hypothetical protein